MSDWHYQTAVVTGAASGLGLAMARAFGRLGTQVVLADLPGAPLRQAVAHLSAEGLRVQAVAVDVTDIDSVQALARQVDEWGGADVLCNNAGITGDRPRECWAQDPANWRRVLDVNLLGVVHGLHAFVPRMITSGRRCHIVNTASMGALIALPYIAPYIASKHALLALSQSLRLELKQTAADIGVSVLCPGLVNTAMTGPGRDHPDSQCAAPSDPAAAFARQVDNALGDAKVSAADVADEVVSAICNRRFRIMTHPGSLDLARRHWQQLLHRSNPEECL
ncbi:SDR family NAD(P)-dependent oxidoreductase [Pseudomonas silvicola]|nr:SDR family NAD(P)-dependent oxidoreductase [Pseudomonas silvicola]